jgi:hypothetical protein
MLLYNINGFHYLIFNMKYMVICMIFFYNILSYLKLNYFIIIFELLYCVWNVFN